MRSVTDCKHSQSQKKNVNSSHGLNLWPTFYLIYFTPGIERRSRQITPPEKLQLATSRQFNIQKLQQGDTSRCKIETNVRLVLYFSFLSHSFPVCQPVAQEENVYSTQTTILYSILKTENVYSIPTILYNISRTENVYSIPTRFFYTASLFTPGSFRMSY